MEHWKTSDAWFEYQDMLRKGPKHNLVNVEDYCQRRSNYLAKRTIEYDKDGLPTKEHKKVYTQYATTSFVGKELGEFVTIVLPNQGQSQTPAQIPVDVDIVYAANFFWHLYHELDKYYLCENQRMNIVPGAYHMTNKDELITLATDYAKYYVGREHCYSPWDYIPRTYVMQDEQDCREIIDILAKEESEEIKYLGKIARESHRAQGITLMTKEESLKLVEQYRYGEACPNKKAQYIVQQYVGNPLLLDGHKFHFRTYMAIASAKPLMIFYQHGYLRLASEIYDSEAKDINTHVTNVAYNEQSNTGGASTHEEFSDEFFWMMKDFKEYLKRKQLVEDGWVDNSMIPKMKKLILHTIRGLSEHILRHPGVFELYGLDIMLDANMDMWLLEVTPIPQQDGPTPAIADEQRTNQKSLIDMQYAQMMNDQALFDKIMEDSYWEWVYDERKQGMERYHGLLTQECL